MAVIYAPHITSPQGGEAYNLGRVAITWNINDPPTDDEYGSTSIITYEIEYTINYRGEDETVWQTLKRRIPWSTTSYTWVVGKMIKSNSVRLRMRARNETDYSTSDWSLISGNFSVNVFKLLPPAIVNPLPNYAYIDYILIILDESSTKSTFNQKIRYTFEYSSESRDVDWTVIARDVPFGQNVVRWNLNGLLPADDYILRVTTKNASTSCVETTPSTADQIVRNYVYNLKIQQPGAFIIDTLPPETILKIENNTGVTNELVQTVSIFAEDATTSVEQIQMRECDSASAIGLGNTEALMTTTEDCPAIETLLSNPNLNFNKIIGKPTGYSSKTQWIFEDKSGFRKLEALASDAGKNTSLQRLSKTFINIYEDTEIINDFIISAEQRDNIVIEQDNNGEIVIVTESAQFEVAYLGTNKGKYWILEPFPRLLSELSVNREIKLLYKFLDSVYIMTYENSSSVVDTGSVYRDDKTELTHLFDFTTELAIPKAVSEYDSKMYIGLENGDLWSYDGVSFSKKRTFSDPISDLTGDDQYLYIGMSNSSTITLYNGTDFFNSTIDF